MAAKIKFLQNVQIRNLQQHLHSEMAIHLAVIIKHRYTCRSIAF